MVSFDTPDFLHSKQQWISIYMPSIRDLYFLFFLCWKAQVMILWEQFHTFWPTLPYPALPILLHSFEMKGVGTENVHFVHMRYTLYLASYLLFGLLVTPEWCSCRASCNNPKCPSSNSYHKAHNWLWLGYIVIFVHSFTFMYAEFLVISSLSGHMLHHNCSFQRLWQWKAVSSRRASSNSACRQIGFSSEQKTPLH